MSHTHRPVRTACPEPGAEPPLAPKANGSVDLLGPGAGALGEGARTWRAPRAWPALLAVRDQAAAIALLVPLDPLDLRALVAERIEARALVVDAPRIQLHVLTELIASLRPEAQAGATLGLGPSARRTGLRVGPAWLVALVDRALQDVVHGTLGALVPGVDAEQGDAERAPAAGCRARGAPCAAEVSVVRVFAQRALLERRAAWEVLLERRPVEEVAHAQGVAVDTLARRIGAVALALARALAAAPDRPAPCGCLSAASAFGAEMRGHLTSLGATTSSGVSEALGLLRVLHATRRGPRALLEPNAVEAALERRDAARFGAALRSLLGDALTRTLPLDSHLDFTCGAARLGGRAAWGELLELGARVGPRSGRSVARCVAALDPLAAPDELASALVEIAERASVAGAGPMAADGADPRAPLSPGLPGVAPRTAAMEPAEVALWRLRLQLASGEPREFAEAALALAARGGGGPRLMFEAHRDAAAAWLDALAPERALAATRAAEQQRARLDARDRARLVALERLVAAALGSGPAAQRSASPRGAGLSVDGPSVAGPSVAGSSVAGPRAEHKARLRSRALRARDPMRAAAFGASVLFVAALHGPHAEVVHLDLAPDPGPTTDAERGGAPADWRWRGGAQESPSPLVVGAQITPTALQRAAFEAQAPHHVEAAGVAAGLVDPAARRAVCVPIFDERQAVIGWVQLEWRHRAPLAPAALDALAVAWRWRALAALARRAAVDAAQPPRAARVVSAPLLAPDPAFAEWAQALIARAGLRGAQRRWLLAERTPGRRAAPRARRSCSPGAAASAATPRPPWACAASRAHCPSLACSTSAARRARTRSTATPRAASSSAARVRSGRAMRSRSSQRDPSSSSPTTGGGSRTRSALPRCRSMSCAATRSTGRRAAGASAGRPRSRGSPPSPAQPVRSLRRRPAGSRSAQPRPAGSRSARPRVWGAARGPRLARSRRGPSRWSGRRAADGARSLGG
ncbi:MAG: hypothetical protein R3F49_23595 [Planctomycetota bacterium]